MVTNPSYSLFAVDLNLLFTTLVQDKNEPEHQFTSLTSKCVISPKGTEEEANYLGKRQYLKLFKAGTDTSRGVVIVTFEISWMPSGTFFDLARPRETSKAAGLLIVDEGYLSGQSPFDTDT